MYNLKYCRIFHKNNFITTYLFLKMFIIPLNDFIILGHQYFTNNCGSLEHGNSYNLIINEVKQV